MATFLAIDAGGLADNLSGEKSLTVDAEEDEEGYDYGEFDDSDDDLDDDDVVIKTFVDSLKKGIGGPNPGSSTSRRNVKPKKPKEKAQGLAAWKKPLAEMTSSLTTSGNGASPYIRRTPTYRQELIWYLLDLNAYRHTNQFRIDFFSRVVKKNGEFGKLKRRNIQRSDIPNFIGPDDREMLDLLLGSQPQSTTSYSYGNYPDYSTYGRSLLAPGLWSLVLGKLSATGRLGWIEDNGGELTSHPLIWDDGPAWGFQISVETNGPQKAWVMDGQLRREEESRPLGAAKLLLPDGMVMFHDQLARLDATKQYQWMTALRRNGALTVPFAQQDDFVAQLWQAPALPDFEWPKELQWETTAVLPVRHVTIKRSTNHYRDNKLDAEVSFIYEGTRVTISDKSAGIVDKIQRRVIRRDLATEADAVAQLRTLGFSERRSTYYSPNSKTSYELTAKKLPLVVPQLVALGWLVEAEGKLLRSAGEFKINVTSDVDWFDLSVQCDFDGQSAGLPELLAAVRKGVNYVELGDGSRGMLPEDWLKKFAPLADLGTTEEETLRFKPTQAIVLDALLAAQENVTVDAGFGKLRQKIRSFDGIAAKEAPRYFSGTLREYQREGLGWLHFLREFGFGGCLADDMGLGKTIQVLALLEARRNRRCVEGETKKPSLAVVPKSLVFNWREEAARFTPKLRVLTYTGIERAAVRDQFHEYDLIVTTYGTLRRDITLLTKIPFDYAILDEAQAIKNSDAQAAKACRLLNADHRLAMTGTPVENHLGELWSLFEFLNPGMLGRSGRLHELISASGKQGSTEGNAIRVLGQALRPFMLRRTKEKVLTELPAKTEQTLFCELEGKQRKLYDELRDHYRASLTQKILQVGMKRCKIHVLEALLRLRQAACHPGLIDKAKVKEGSAKLETLLEQLGEVLAEGHKVLVFSQFTSLLAIVRAELDKAKIVYEYLDGKTNNRQALVERFQTDKDCPVFLISLKAGGQGLNLTAADYVYILDPWWNPAVEAQAVDRVHRIGQSQPVFAYRLIARGTIEEKILELQSKKKQLADAIVSADNSLLGDLTADDLAFLLS